MNDTTGRGMGVARPRMLMLGNGKGPLLLSGGRLYTEQTRDILLWVSWDGMGENWETYSLSYHHNSLVKPALRFSAAVNSTSGRATTSYTSLLALDSDNAVVIYNGETGIFAMRVSRNMPKKTTNKLDVSPPRFKPPCDDDDNAHGLLTAIPATHHRTTAAECCPAGATSVDASCWLRSHGEDAVAVQAAVDCGAKQVVMAVREAPWVFNQSVRLRVDGQTILLKSGVVIQALRGGMHSKGAHLLSLSNVTGVSLSGYGAVLQMWKQDYNDPTQYNHSEWRHGIEIGSSHHILIEGVTVTQTGGDGIDIGGDQSLMDECEREIRAGSSYSRYCDSTNIHVRDVQLLNNSRNAMSVTGVVNLTVERSRLAQTGSGSGTCCKGGVDMEPETPFRHISNVSFRHVTFEENGMTQVVMNLGAQGNNTDNIMLDSCVIQNSSSHSNAGSGLWIIGVGSNAPKGTITLRNTTIQNIRDFGIRIEKKAADGALVVFEGGRIQNVAYAGHWPILVQAGGVHFQGTVVHDAHKRNWLEPGWRTTQKVVDVEGSVTVYAPGGVCTEGFNASRGDEHGKLLVDCRAQAKTAIEATVEE
jgi:hypothetical protein